MCGGFTSSKNALIALNILYIFLGSLLIGVGVYAIHASIVTSLPIVGGILACGIILLLISILGLAGAVRHHQVMLFFYMIILFFLFLIQFSIASACLAVNSEQRQEIAEKGWNQVHDSIHQEVQNSFLCCGFNQTSSAVNGDTCEEVNKKCCSTSNSSNCSCPACLPVLENVIADAFNLCGGLGIFFSFTELIAVFLAYRYRNQHDPYYLPPRAIFPHDYLY